MAKLNMQSATARRSLVIKLVDDALIHSQSDLVRELGKIGYVVTPVSYTHLTLPTKRIV